jgi:hypothetical protein
MAGTRLALGGDREKATRPIRTLGRTDSSSNRVKAGFAITSD